MEQLKSDANVVIRMKGLGILHFNENSKLWEAILLRDIEAHELKITVCKFDAGGNQIGLNEYSIPKDIKRVAVTTNNTPGSQPDPFFDKNVSNFGYDPNSNDIKDWRWTINLSEELHRNPVTLSNKTKGNLTLLTISDATLYTAELHDKTTPYVMVDVFSHPLPQNLGRVNPRVIASFVGLDIVWNNPVTPETQITFGGKVIPLPQDSSIAKYEVWIDNNCPKDKCPFPGDFDSYYDHLVDMGNERFDESIPGLASLLPLNITEMSDFAQPKSFQLFEGFKKLVEDYDGKTNDCGFVMCTRLENIKSLEDLVK